MILTPEKFSAVARAMFGRYWIAETARALECTDRTIRDYASGKRPIPPERRARFCAIRNEKLQALTAAGDVCDGYCQV